MLGEEMTDLGDGAVLVVRQDLEHNGDPTRAVPFIHDFLIRHALQLPRTLLDRPINGIVRHTRGLRRSQSGT